MKVQSTTPFPAVPESWKKGQLIIYFNQSEETTDEGVVYEAEMTILKSVDDMERALTRHFCDPELEQKVAFGIQVNGQDPINIEKNYNPTEETRAKVSEIVNQFKN